MNANTAGQSQDSGIFPLKLLPISSDYCVSGVALSTLTPVPDHGTSCRDKGGVDGTITCALVKSQVATVL